MSDLSAVPPGSILESFQKLTEKPVIKKEIQKSSRLASLANSSAFKELQQQIDSWINDLKDPKIDPKTDTVESIGFRCLASKVTIEYLESVRNLPERHKRNMELANEAEKDSS